MYFCIRHCFIVRNEKVCNQKPLCRCQKNKKSILKTKASKFSIELYCLLIYMYLSSWSAIEYNFQARVKLYWIIPKEIRMYIPIHFRCIVKYAIKHVQVHVRNNNGIYRLDWKNLKWKQYKLIVLIGEL